MYNPNNSKLSETALSDFIQKPITGDLSEVPGLRETQIRLLARGGDKSDQITNTFQLIGKFLLLKRNKKDTNYLISSKEQCDLFCKYLKNKGINSFRTEITLAIAEKVNIMFPGVYNYEEF